MTGHENLKCHDSVDRNEPISRASQSLNPTHLAWYFRYFAADSPEMARPDFPKPKSSEFRPSTKNQKSGICPHRHAQPDDLADGHCGWPSHVEFDFTPFIGQCRRERPSLRECADGCHACDRRIAEGGWRRPTDHRGCLDHFCSFPATEPDWGLVIVVAQFCGPTGPGRTCLVLQ